MPRGQKGTWRWRTWRLGISLHLTWVNLGSIETSNDVQPNRHDFQNSRPRYGKSSCGRGGAVRAGPSSARRPDFQPPGMGILARLAGDATVQSKTAKQLEEWHVRYTSRGAQEKPS